MTVRHLPLSEIAMSVGFANQNHFTQVVSGLVGVNSGAWRREALGAPEGQSLPRQGPAAQPRYSHSADRLVQPKPGD
jgi:AraC-like DNA-binding protein